MRRPFVYEFISLNGVVQPPGAPEQDRIGGFQRGGWHLPYFGDLSQKWALESLTGAGASSSGTAPTRSSPYWPEIDPLVLGGGKRLSRDDGALRPPRIVDSQSADHQRDPRDLRTGRATTSRWSLQARAQGNEGTEERG